MWNTIVAKNYRPVNVPNDLSGDFASLGHNLIGQGEGGVGLTNGIQGDLVGSAAAPLDPLLAPLINNGGSTPTHALLAGSPALNSGDSTAPCAEDQRGVPRCGMFDIGAFEQEYSEPPSLALNGDNPLTLAAGMPYVEPGATASDVCGMDLTGGIIITGSVNSAVPASYTIVYAVTDAGNNTTVTNRTVFVVDVALVSGLNTSVTETNQHTGSRTVRLEGAVNPNGLETVAFIEYGLNAGYSGAATAAVLPATYGVNHPVSTYLDGVIPGVTYHWHVHASNALGVTYVPAQVFTVPAIFPHGDVNGDGLVDQGEFDSAAQNYWGTMSRPYMTNLFTDGQGYWQMTLTNAAAWEFTVEVSTNLVDWDYLGPAWPYLDFYDPEATNQPQRYYRLSWP